MSILITDPNIAVLQGTVERINITVQNAASDPAVDADPAELKLTVMDNAGTVLFIDRWPQQGNRITQSSTGHFHVDFGYASATLDGPISAGVTTLTVLDAIPATTAGWPEDSFVRIDTGQSTYEQVYIDTVSLVAGVGTITLLRPTEYAHDDGAYLTVSTRETGNESEWMFNWQVKLSSGGEVTNVLQKVNVMSVRAASFLPDLRQMIDKSHKLTAPSSECFLGYTDSQLLYYLYAGLQNINAYQPSLNFTMMNFPLEYRQILIDSALISGVMSQQLYAIDTDIPNYNDQGTSFVITHQQQLASFLNQITARLDKLIPMMKLQLLNPGSLHVQMGPSFRLQTLMSAAPSGSIFRGVFFKG